MTSPKPGVDAWIELSDTVVLSVVRHAHASRFWTATNCLATRRRPGRAQQRHDTLNRTTLTPATVQELQQLDAARLAQTVVVSLHCRERFSQRALPGVWAIDAQRARWIRQLIGDSGRLVSPAPAWADGAGTGGPCILADLQPADLAADMDACPTRDLLLSLSCTQLAFPLACGSDRQPTLTTCLSAADVLADVAALRADATNVRIPSRLLNATTERQLRRLLKPDTAQLISGGVTVDLTDGRTLRLRPASDDDRRAHGCAWTATCITEDRP